VMMRRRAERERGVLLQVPRGKVLVPRIRDFTHDCFFLSFVTAKIVPCFSFSLPEDCYHFSSWDRYQRDAEGGAR
jgi:hypothetical protein